MAKVRGRFKKKKGEGGIIITSLIDIFTILLIFLIRNFSAEGNLTSNAENLTLPNSFSTKRLEEPPLQVEVTNDMVVVDNVPVVPTEDIAKISQEESEPVVGKLLENLRAHYIKEEEMVKIGVSNKVEGKIVIQMDKNIAFDVLYKIMYTCGKAGYNAMNFAVMQREPE